MDITQIVQAIILGIVEGLTEFLPVSSTGHLILFKEVLNFETPPGFVFEIAIQVGSMMAICWLYRQKFWNVASTINTKPSQKFVGNILLAFLPSMIVGAVVYKYVKEHFFNAEVVAISLIIGGIGIIIIERLSKIIKFKTVDDISTITALEIGLIQLISIIPGVSRSGATIMGSLLCGVDRKAAAEFSFFLGLPTIMGATAYTLYKNWAELNLGDFQMIAVGFITAFIAGLAVVKFMINFVSKHGFQPFAYYRIIIGTIILLSI